MKHEIGKRVNDKNLYCRGNEAKQKQLLNVEKLLIAHLVCSSNIMLFLIQSPYSKAENKCTVEHSKIWFILGPYCNLTCQTIRKISALQRLEFD